jgi:hypothetical protein
MEIVSFLSRLISDYECGCLSASSQVLLRSGFFDDILGFTLKFLFFFQKFLL